MHCQGRLTQLPLADTGLICPRGLPASISNLTALETLDLANNLVNDTVANVGKVSKLVYLCI